jgi:hypothetical protein
MTILATYDFSDCRMRYAFTREAYTAEQLDQTHGSKTKANKLITQLAGGRAHYASVHPEADPCAGVAQLAIQLATTHDTTLYLILPPSGWVAIDPWHQW